MKAFSLIELLVVLAIVGFLTAIAAPIYSQYTSRVKIASAYTYLASEIERLKTLITIGSSEQINDPSNYNNFNNASEANLPNNPSPYILNLYESASDPHNGFCANASVAAELTNFDGKGNALVTNTGSLQLITLRVFDVNGAYIETCKGYTLAWPQYTYITGLMPEGCYDEGDANQYAAYTAMVDNINATAPCQIIS